MQRLLAALAISVICSASVSALAQEHSHETPPPPRIKWSFAGPFGKYNPAQLQRGFKVYKEVCSVCHAMSMLAFRNLADAGGPGFNEAQAKSVASEYKIKDLDDKGEPVERNGQLADYFPSPQPNDRAAAATYGVAPPDMSTLAKARTYERGFPWFVLDAFTQYQEQGPDYIAAYVNGYKDPPQGFDLPKGSHYNEYFPGHATAMPRPLQDGQVTYDDGTPQTVVQYSQDVSAFLMWVAEPHMTARKRLGLQVMIFLIVLAGLLYFTKKRVWKDVARHPSEATHRPVSGQEYKR